MEKDINKLFPTAPVRNTNATHKRDYDVRISLNKSGGDRWCIRFGLINNASKEASKHGFAEVSDIEYMPTRLYFRFHDWKDNRNIHILSASTKAESLKSSCYFCITPAGKAEKLYRANWIGKTYRLQFDDDVNLFYIENAEG